MKAFSGIERPARLKLDLRKLERILEDSRKHSIDLRFKAEAEVSALLVQLSPVDSRILVGRISRRQPEDQLVAAFVTSSNLMPDRQDRLHSTSFKSIDNHQIEHRGFQRPGR